jgi:L-seryl-tRNA(Ser) seleniumtransferase
VLISRGELVEIGGSFRVPEILGASRARLREIGTTNRTHLADYADAIGPDTGMILKVHRSNFRVEGFTAEAALPSLAGLARERGLPLVEDRGSGTFLDLRAHGIPEREVGAGLADGADLVVFSGDKLLGGPQAGIALGRSELVARLRANPLARALRIDKLTLAALDWTLRALLDGREREIPVLRMLLADPEELARRAEQLAAGLRAAGWSGISVQRGASPVGGGSLPELELPGAVVRIELGEREAGRLAAALRRADPPVLVRVQRGAVCLDPRTLDAAGAEKLLSHLAAGPPGPR